MEKNIFKEKQKLRSIEIFALFSLVIIGTLYRLVADLVAGNSVFTTATITIVILLIVGLTIYYMLKMELKLSVNDKRIKFKLSPWQTHAQKINWDDVESYEIIETPPLAQWSGGNISFGREKKYSFAGRNGLLLTTKEGEQYFLGSRRLGELEKTIKRIFRKK